MTGQKLSEVEQKKHDDVIEFVKARLVREGHKVKVNKGTNKTNAVNDTNDKGEKIKIYPDVYTYEEGHLKSIYEIETQSSVNESEVPQWKQYSKGGVDFFLVVPEDKLEVAKELVDKHQINVKNILTHS